MDIVGFLIVTIAGAGIAPASQGYEPREVLLLYPARLFYTIYARKSRFHYSDKKVSLFIFSLIMPSSLNACSYEPTA